MKIKVSDDAIKQEQTLATIRPEVNQPRKDCSVLLSIKTVWLLLSALCLVLAEVTKQTSQFNCVYPNIDPNKQDGNTELKCEHNFLPLGIFSTLLVLGTLPHCSSVLAQTMLSFFQLSGLIWLKFLVEQYNDLAGETYCTANFGYVILCGITMAQISSIPKATPKAQCAYTFFMFLVTVIALVTEFSFSEYWKWSNTGLVVIFLILIPAAIAIFITLCSFAENDDRHHNPMICFAGLCFLLLILIPTTHNDQLLLQVSLVATGSAIYLLEWLTPTCMKREYEESEVTQV